VLTLVLAAAVSAPALAGEWRFSGYAGVEPRWFPDSSASPTAFDGGQLSIVTYPEWDWQPERGRSQLRIVPFLRWDGQDDERTHFDLREAYWRYGRGDWEIVAGVDRVFWGVTESRHLVDVINQIGQPMVRLSLQKSWGRLENFLLLGFRERTFPGQDGRPSFPLPIDTDGALYESGAEDRRLDFSTRWSHYIGDWDVGAHFFHGTGREPTLVPAEEGDRLLPFYQVIDQVGADVQYTRNAWLWKFEGLVRSGQGQTFGATVAGFEYTLYQVGGSAADVGALVEYLWDDRDPTAPATPFDDDVFVGSRLALNDTQDTQVLAGAVIDRHTRTTFALLEAERRVAASWKVELEGRWFLDVAPGDPLAAFERDSFVTLRLARYF
jgi:hypothetical protein